MTKRADSNDRRIVKKAMEMAIKSPKPLDELEEDARQFLRTARAEQKPGA